LVCHPCFEYVPSPSFSDIYESLARLFTSNCVVSVRRTLFPSPLLLNVAIVEPCSSPLPTLSRQIMISRLALSNIRRTETQRMKVWHPYWKRWNSKLIGYCIGWTETVLSIIGCPLPFLITPFYTSPGPRIVIRNRNLSLY
jgi:hypothetical protein